MQYKNENSSATAFTPNPRQDAIVEAVKQQGATTIEALALRFQVTLQTVRRDVQRLAEAGLLARFHGGVRIPVSTTENVTYMRRQAMQAVGKQRIARAVAARIPNGCSVMLNIGTTTEAVAQELLSHKGLRVITNNLNVAATLSANEDCEVIVAGGVVRSVDRGITGEATVDFMRQFKVDIGLIGISGIEEDGTLRDFDFREVKVAKAIIASARQVWLCADSTKFSRPAMVELASFDALDVVFTDMTPPPLFSDLMTSANVECVVASE